MKCHCLDYVIKYSPWMCMSYAARDYAENNVFNICTFPILRSREDVVRPVKCAVYRPGIGWAVMVFSQEATASRSPTRLDCLPMSRWQSFPPGTAIRYITYYPDYVFGWFSWRLLKSWNIRCDIIEEVKNFTLRFIPLDCRQTAKACRRFSSSRVVRISPQRVLNCWQCYFFYFFSPGWDFSLSLFRVTKGRMYGELLQIRN